MKKRFFSHVCFIFFIAVFFVGGAISRLSGLTLDEFYLKRPDIPNNISKWSGNTDKIWILKEWIKITTERGEDYKTALKILLEIESGKPQVQPQNGFPPSETPSLPGSESQPSLPSETPNPQPTDSSNGETICGIGDGAIESAKQGAQRAKEHGLMNIIRIDYKSGIPAPADPADYKAFGDSFIATVKKLSGVCDLFIVGNEPTIEGNMTAQEYASAFLSVYRRKGEMPSGTKLLAAGPAGFSWDSREKRDFLSWLEDMASRLDEVDGFALHTYGDPTQGGADPRVANRRNNWPFDGGFMSFKEQIERVAKKWEGNKPIFITEFNTDVNGLKDAPNSKDNYQKGWINKAFEAVRNYNATRGALPPVKALCWFVDRADGPWGSFSLREIGDAREDMKKEFHNPAN
ncbi:hypothetical protein HYY75_11870 [bacterium]|nr:hypothetical protein [bacterium]